MRASAGSRCRLANPSPLHGTIAVTGSSGVDATDYALPNGAQSFDLAPGESASLPVVFKPGGLGSRFASLNLTLTSLCGPVSVALAGQGVASVISCGGESQGNFWEIGRASCRERVEIGGGGG